MKHPRHQLDDAFLTPVRLSLMAALGRSNEIDFATLKTLLEVEDSALSKAISYLVDAGYAKALKGTVGNRPRTWVTSTAAGYRSYERHLLALRAITAPN
ncbi:transcriptional regulator [Salinibacterium sp. SWN1162]|uniref:transcriptional regulator n=1 Tax=Salinibacterium sp. SWN1162 TaxID=2792053 RepID=UPI0018CD0A39|nr:transcriptional regulator [Salinibacterium sp. SWN1162]MBH0009430.1 transcriptional regulator [Salinibacterium sp. SWN1162]